MPSSGFVRRFVDLIGCIAVALLMLAFTLLSLTNSLTIVLGGLLVFLVPGYALTCLLWGAQSELDVGDRIIFTVGLSASLTVFSVLLLSLTGAGIFPLTVTLALTYEGLVFSVAALALRSARHGGLPRDLVESVDRARGVLGHDRPFWAIVAVLLVAAVILLALIVSTPSPPITTQFYVLGPDGTSSSLPTAIAANVSASLLVGAYNGAAQAVTFTITVCLAVGNGSCSGPAGPSADWGSALSLVPSGTYRLNLSVDGDARVEMPLRFLVTVPGDYVMSLTLDGTGIQREVRLALRVTP